MRTDSAPVIVTIESLSHDGRGVARIDGKTVFVDGALPGEEVRIVRHRAHRRYDHAMVEEVLKPSAHRVVPLCQHFGHCGGCSLQHLEASQQLEAKRRHVAEELARVGKVEPGAWLPSLTGPAWRYRRRARLGCKYVHKKERVLVGFRERSSPYIAETIQCEVLADPVGRLIAPLAELIGGLSIRERTPQIEVAVADSATALVLRVLSAPSEDDLQRLRDFAAAHGIEWYLQPGGLNTVTALTPPPTPLVYAVAGLEAGIEFLPTDFVQVNAAVNAGMLALAMEWLAVGPGDQVLDLFCGLGNFSLPLARQALGVTGVEGDAALVSRAAHNAARNGIDNARFFTGDLFQSSRDLPWARGRYDRILLDPPRAGAREVLELVSKAGARRLVYVSCHPGTLARDAGELVHQHGWSMIRAGVMDMFPQTAHVESIAVFEPR